MRFRLHHLLIVFAVIAIGLFSIDQYVCDTATVEFSSPSVVTQKFKTFALNYPHAPGPLIDKDVDYQIPYTIHNTTHSISGTVFGTYGYNRLLGTELTESNVSQFEGRTVKIKFRRWSLPWMHATQVSDELDKHFLSHWTYQKGV